MLTRLPLDPIQLWVSDITKGGTRYKQRARAHHLGITLPGPAGVGLLLEVHVTAHAVLPDGTAGEELTLNGLPFRKVFLHVDPATSVYFNPDDPQHPRTGELLSLRGALNEADWLLALETDAEKHAIQNELFGLMLTTEQRVAFLLLAEIWRADQLGKFNDVPTPLLLGTGL